MKNLKTVKNASSLKMKSMIVFHLWINNIELWIVGDGPEKENLYSRAKLSLQNQITWFGTVQMSKIPNIMNQADCLVLPSKHDGWGAVASEALMLGIPVICSSSCGASSIVKSSGFGGVFFSNNKNSLMVLTI